MSVTKAIDEERGTRRCWRMCFLGVHGSDDQGIFSDLDDLGVLLGKTPFGTPFVAMGDWNIQYVSTMVELDLDRTRSEQRRGRLEAWAEAKKAVVMLPL